MNWEAITHETVDNLSRLIQAETINPPGNEERAIEVIKDILEGAGFPAEDWVIVEGAPGRSNLVARLRGDGSQRPLLLSGHVDVVPVEREHWDHDPFSGEVIEGAVWGRGALDMKGALAMYLQVFLEAFRQKLPLKRDLILAAIADEEAGFTYGSKFLVDEHRALIDAEYALNEGGAMNIQFGGVRLYPIQVAEKGVCWMRMTATGKPGHGSAPHEDNAVLHLAQALDRLRRARHLPLHITAPVKGMLDAIAAHLGFPGGLAIGMLGNPTLAKLLIPRLPAKTRSLMVAMLSNSVSATVLKAGSKTNVIPSSAMAHLDCRLLPGQTPEDAMREVLAVTGDRVSLEPLTKSDGAAFPVDSPLYRLLVKATQEMDPTGLAAPILMPGATDAAQYKRAGITVYGFTPGVFPDDFAVFDMVHGHNERMPVSALRSGLPALWQVVREFACG